jgi:hypothetical protein
VNASLKIIRGNIQNLEVHAGEEDFIRSEAQRTVGASAAIGLAAAGLAGPAVGASIAATGRDSVEFFSCTVNGERIAGRFSKVTFNDGDEVEVVAESGGEGVASAVAVRRPADRKLWMFPHCSRGRRAHRSFALRMFIWLSGGLMVFYCGFFGIVEWRSSEPSSTDMLLFFALLFGSIAVVMAGYFAIRFARTWRYFADKAETIFSALGYPDPARVDLGQDNKRACKALGQKWPYSAGGAWIYHYPEQR